MSTAFTAPVGGVMTRQAGAITGELELVELADGVATVRYAGAEDVYRVVGRAPGSWHVDDVVAHLSADPGMGEVGNPAAVALP